MRADKTALRPRQWAERSRVAADGSTPDCFTETYQMSSAAKPLSRALENFRATSGTTSRIAAAVLGGYAFCWGFIALGMAAMYAAGMSFHDAEHLAAMLGLLLYLTVFCWSFVDRSLLRVWLVLAGGGLLMTGAAELLKRSLVAAAGGL